VILRKFGATKFEPFLAVLSVSENFSIILPKNRLKRVYGQIRAFEGHLNEFKRLSTTGNKKFRRFFEVAGRK
jgi:hypothetical protein